MKLSQRPDPALLDDAFRKEVSKLWPVASLRTVAAATTLSGDTYVLVSATTNITLTLPPLSQSKWANYKVMKADSTANTVTLDGTGTEAINGSATYVINSQYVAIDVIADSVDARWLAFAVRT